MPREHLPTTSSYPALERHPARRSAPYASTSMESRGAAQARPSLWQEIRASALTPPALPLHLPVRSPADSTWSLRRPPLRRVLLLYFQIRPTILAETSPLMALPVLFQTLVLLSNSVPARSFPMAPERGT